MVDVVTSIGIDRPRQIVAAYAADPGNAPAWYVNIKSIEWLTAARLEVGARIAFVAKFLARRLECTYQVTEFVAGEGLMMRTAEGPFPLETTYTWEDSQTGCTRMKLRNRGEPAGFSRLVSPLMVFAMRRANQNDLRRLKSLLEQ